MYQTPMIMPSAAFAFAVAEAHGKPCKVFAEGGHWFVAFGL